jgi:hypothetical protein
MPRRTTGAYLLGELPFGFRQGANVTGRKALCSAYVFDSYSSNKIRSLCISPGEHGRVNAPPDDVSYL